MSVIYCNIIYDGHTSRNLTLDSIGSLGIVQVSVSALSNRIMFDCCSDRWLHHF